MTKSLKVLSVGSLPLTLATAKSHLRVLHNDDDDAITSLIAAGVDEFERRTGRAFSAITAELRLSEFPDEAIAIPRPPLQSITSIVYTTAAGVVTMPAGDTIVDATSSPALVLPKTSWPAGALDRPGAVVVTFAAGNVANVSAQIKNALLVWLDLQYHEQGNELISSAGRMVRRVESILQNHGLRHVGLSGLTVLE